MEKITFGIGLDDGGYASIVEIVRELVQKGWYIPIDATIELLGNHITLPVPEDVYSRPTKSTSQRRRYMPISEIAKREAAWRVRLKEGLEGLVEIL